MLEDIGNMIVDFWEILATFKRFAKIIKAHEIVICIKYKKEKSTTYRKKINKSCVISWYFVNSLLVRK